MIIIFKYLKDEYVVMRLDILRMVLKGRNEISGGSYQRNIFMNMREKFLIGNIV